MAPHRAHLRGMAELQPEPVAIVDTNVMLDVLSLHDLDKTYCDDFAKLGPAARDTTRFQYRHERARSSFLMALHFDAIGATTHPAQAELERLLYANVPKVAGGEDIRCDFTTFHLHFVKDMVLRSWNSRLRPAGELVEGKGRRSARR